MNNRIIIYTDGGKLLNVKFGLTSIVVESPENNEIIYSNVEEFYSHYFTEFNINESPTNNYCEFMAVFKALQYIEEKTEIFSNQPINFEIYTDSQLVVNQIKGEWSIESSTSKYWVPKIISKLNQLKEKYSQIQISLNLIPREINKAGKLLEAYTIENRLNLYRSVINKQNSKNGSMD